MSDVGPFTLAPLIYDYAALEPVIDAETMRLHHDRHHQAYVDALNTALAAHPQLQGKTVEALLSNLNDAPAEIRTTIRNQGGGHANHQLFWKVMAPPNRGGGGRASGELLAQIEADFGSFEEMQSRFEKAGAGHFGSGWVQLVVNPASQRLEIITLANQDSSLELGKPALLSNDLWEHAYYLQHHNRRPQYLKAWWAVVDWPYIAKRFHAVRSGNEKDLGGASK